MHANQLSSQVRTFLNQAGITELGAYHLFRPTAVTLLLDHGADIRHTPVSPWRQVDVLTNSEHGDPVPGKTESVRQVR